MQVLNVMLGRGSGGLEQAALDYAEALCGAGYGVTSVLAPGGWALGRPAPQGAVNRSLRQFGEWDLLAALRLRRLIASSGARIAIGHGNRAIGLLLRAARARVPVVGVAHNYNIRRFDRLDAAFAITDDLAGALSRAGVARERIHKVPNLVRMPDHAPARPAFREPPVIAAMGRFVPKKGFDVFLEALALLAGRGGAFRAVIGGEGTCGDSLRAQAAALGLSDRVTFAGWVRDKQAFFDAADIFVVPSRHEPFGIVVIEAMAQGLPVISSASEGPREILTPEGTGLLTPVGDAAALAQGLHTLLSDAAAARAMGERGRDHAARTYALPRVGEQLGKAIDAVLAASR